MHDTSISTGSTVTLHYSLAIEDGTVVDSSFEGAPITFTIGDGTMIEGLEIALVGMEKGEDQSISIPPNIGFGYPEQEAVQTMALDEFPADMAPEVGQIIAFNMPNGEEIPGTILKVDGGAVEVDFNHPLAGHEVIFTAKVIDVVNPADEDEE